MGAGNGITVTADAVAAKAGNGITVNSTGINHYTPSSVAENITAADRTYVKSLTFDDYGHVTGYTTGTESNQDLSSYVTGPNISTDNAIARYDGETGKLIQNSRATIDDTGNLKVNNSDGGDIGLILGRGPNAD